MGQEVEIKGVVSHGVASATEVFDCSKGNTFTVTLAADATFGISNLKPGHNAVVVVTQNATGGWRILDWTAGAQSVTNALDASIDADPSGISTFLFRGMSSTSANLVTSTNSGDSPDWLEHTDWYIDPINGNDSNLGYTLAAPLKTYDEFKHRVVSQFSRSSNWLTCHILSDITADVAVLANWPSPLANPTITFDGELGRTSIATGTVVTSTVVNAATNQEYTIQATGIVWASFLGKTAIVASGTNVGSSFIILKDLGGGVAQVSEVSLDNSYGVPSVVSPGDLFHVFTFPQFGNSVTITGPAGILFHQLKIGGNFTHSTTILNSVAQFDTCAFYECDADSGSNVLLANSFVASRTRAYGSRISMFTGATLGTLVARRAGLLDFSDYTIVGGSISGDDVVGWISINTGYLGIYDVTTAISVPSGYTLTTNGTPAQLMGKNVVGPKIYIGNGASMYYLSGSLPTMTGSGADLSIGGTSKNWADLPFVNATNLAKATTLT